jgi:hypothetical protein
MSLIHNLNKHTKINTNTTNSMLSHEIGAFYMNNEKPTTHDIRTFALTYGIDEEIVKLALIFR